MLPEGTSPGLDRTTEEALQEELLVSWMALCSSKLKSRWAGGGDSNISFLPPSNSSYLIKGQRVKLLKGMMPPPLTFGLPYRYQGLNRLYSSEKGNSIIRKIFPWDPYCMDGVKYHIYFFPKSQALHTKALHDNLPYLSLILQISVYSQHSIH